MDFSIFTNLSRVKSIQTQLDNLQSELKKCESDPVFDPDDVIFLQTIQKSLDLCNPILGQLITKLESKSKPV